MMLTHKPLGDFKSMIFSLGTRSEMGFEDKSTLIVSIRQQAITWADFEPHIYVAIWPY